MSIAMRNLLITYPLLILLILLYSTARRCAAQETSMSAEPSIEVATEESSLEDTEAAAAAVVARRAGHTSDATEEHTAELAAARLPKPEALQGSRGAQVPTRRALHGITFGRIPPSCALCSRERNLCRIISGIFTRSPLPYGYSLVTPVPAGVCNLTINEMKPSKNFFALRRSDGTYILNGNWDIKPAGEYEAGGTTFIYTPGNEENGERLSAPGPLREPVDFMLISQSPNPGIKYEYRVPLPEYSGTNPTGLGIPPSGLTPGALRPGVVPRGSSGSSVSTGQHSAFKPVPSGTARNPTFGIRNPSQGAVFPFNTVAGGRGSTPYRPLTPVLQPVVVGQSGSFNSSNVPIYPISPQGGVSSGVPVRNPSYGVVRAPDVPSASGGVPLHKLPITPIGTGTGSQARPWNPSFGSRDRGRVPLGNPFLQGQGFPRVSGGNNTSPVQSRGEGGGSESTAHDRDTRPGLTSPRDAVFPLGSASVPGALQPSSEGMSHRRGPTSTPPHRTRHRHGTLQTSQGQRKVTEKSPEFPAFDPSVQLTQPKTTPATPSSNRTVSGGLPRRRGGKGGSRRRHRHQQEGKRRRKQRLGVRVRGGRFQWAKKGLSSCSRPCGGGNQTAILSCERKRNKKVVPDRRCAHLQRPEPRYVLCNLTPCPAEWAPGEWEPCSVTCGMGVQTRPLLCKQVVSPTLTMMVPEGACLSPPSIPTSQVCEVSPCTSSTPVWEASPWTNCSVPCGLGNRVRQVSCVLAGVTVSDERCDATARPVREEVCDMGSCATNTWFFSEWSEQCSETCGTGEQTRRIHCLAGDAETSCPASERPDTTRPCMDKTGCGGEWFVGLWSACSEVCGAGTQTRSVICLILVQGRWRVTEDSQCQEETRPEDSRPCNVELCSPEWYTSEWSQCSMSCDGGVTRREVTCLDALRRPSPDCNNTTRPDSRQSCNLKPCNTITASTQTTPLLTPSAAVPLLRQNATGENASVTSGMTDTSNVIVTTPAAETPVEEEVMEEEEEEGNELVVMKTTGESLNIIPDKNAQGDESVMDEEEEEEEEKEEERKKKRKRKKDRKKSKGRTIQGDSEPPSADTTRRVLEKNMCIDRIKNCHLVFRARLCRLKYYNRLCCRTCTAT